MQSVLIVFSFTTFSLLYSFQQELNPDKSAAAVSSARGRVESSAADTPPFRGLHHESLTTSISSPQLVLEHGGRPLHFFHLGNYAAR
jgi:hypothetical protein